MRRTKLLNDQKLTALTWHLYGGKGNGYNNGRLTVTSDVFRWDGRKRILIEN